MAKVKEGDEAPPLVVENLTRTHFVRYAGASGDFNPIHQDEAFAKAAGMGGIFAHGMLSMGFVAQSVTDWVGVGRVRKISVRFAALVRPGDVITCHGRVLDKRPAEGGRDWDAELELWAENQTGEKVVTGRATVTLASRG